MTQVTINGNTYSDDGSSAKDMLNGGHRQWFFPLVSDVVVTAADVAADAAQAAIDAATAAAVAGSTIATSTTSLSPTAGNKTLAIQTGKQFLGGNFVTISRTSDPTIIMHGVVTSYSGSTLQITVGFAVGAVGPFTDWTVALSGAQGIVGASGNGNVAYLAKTAAYTVLATDRGKLIDCTANTFTLSFQGVATLGANWFAYIRNSGTGVITLDPNGAELINGASTYTLNPGTTATLQCDGTTIRVIMAIPTQLVRLPIFSADAVNADGVSTLETIENGSYNTGLGGSTIQRIIFGNSLFITSIAAASSNISTSPDGITWTLRSMPSSSAWMVGTNGSNQFIATAGGGTAIASSTNGTTWSTATALATNAAAALGQPVFNGSLCLVISSTALTAYTSSNNGVSWTTQTLPAAVVTQAPVVVGGLFLIRISTTQYYTSATGATGSWTLRSFPVTISPQLNLDSDGTLYASGNPSNYFSTTDGINWTDLGFSYNRLLWKINGVYFNMTDIFGDAQSRHNNFWTKRFSNHAVLAVSPFVKNTAGTIYVAGGGAADGLVVRIAPTESTTARALFTK